MQLYILYIPCVICQKSKQSDSIFSVAILAYRSMFDLSLTKMDYISIISVQWPQTNGLHSYCSVKVMNQSIRWFGWVLHISGYLKVEESEFVSVVKKWYLWLPSLVWPLLCFAQTHLCFPHTLEEVPLSAGLNCLLKLNGRSCSFAVSTSWRTARGEVCRHFLSLGGKQHSSKLIIDGRLESCNRHT